MSDDWTRDADGRSNSSEQYQDLVSEVERLIRGSAHALINGDVRGVAQLIMSQLAHRHGLRPATLPVSVEVKPGDHRWDWEAPDPPRNGATQDCVTCGLMRHWDASQARWLYAEREQRGTDWGSAQHRECRR